MTVPPSRGKFLHTRRVTVDDTDQVRDQETRREAPSHPEIENYRDLAELLPVAVYTCAAPTGVITYYNSKAAELWGRVPRGGDTDERFCGSFQLFLPDGTFLPHDGCPMAVALREGRAFRSEEVTIRRPDGSRVSVLVNIDPIRDGRGRVTGAINVFHDVTRLKGAERALREQKEELETLLSTVPSAVFLAHDTECRRISGNRAAAELLRMPADANLSLSAESGSSPPHFQVVKDGEPVPAESLPVQRAARGEIVRAEEVDHLFDDGTTVHTIVSAQPLFDAGGRPRGAVASMLDITKLRTAERALRESGQRKDEFLAILSHELRNPLAPIRTALNILRGSPPSQVRFGEMSLVLERQLGQLVRLIDDLLDVSRISRDKLQLRKERVELAGALRQALEMSQPLADLEGHTVEVRWPEQAIHLDADPMRISQVFSNLLNNAYKYTPAGGLIRLAVERRGALAVVSVKDSGVGIESDKLEDIFDMFSQADSQDRSSGGLGIGLPLARRLVGLHGGTIVARSEGPGRGSEFIVELPALEPSAEPPAPVEPPAAAPQRKAVARRILVVDDNADAADMLVTLLELEGHDAHAAYRGHEAIARAEALKPEVILLDIGLPEIDGYEVCRRIRREQWGEAILMVALTGRGQRDDRRRSSESGFDAHLVKPIDKEPLQQLIDAHSRAPDPRGR